MMKREEQKEQSEKKYAQRFLEYYNEQKGTQFANPSRPVQGNYDFNCTDEASGDQIALEITNLADEQVEEIDKSLWRILKQIREETSGRLPGIFTLWVDVPAQPLLLKQERKRVFEEALKDCVYERTAKLKTKREVDLTQQINKRMLPEVFESPRISLKKFSDEGSHLTISSWRSFSASNLTGKEFAEFQRLVGNKNCQLSQAQGRETFLIIVVERSVVADADAMKDAFKRLDPSDYSHIDHVYRIEGSRIERIPLP